jgi:energy-coupling factor transport system ATP-binding protein
MAQVALAGFDRFSYWYPGGEEPALRDVVLEVCAGLTLVTGPSGGGKSTLLRAFNGLVPHFHGGRVAGSARVAGHDLLTTPTSRLARSVGFVFQNPEAQFVHATVEHDVAFGLENTGVPRAEMVDRVEEALAAVGVLGLRQRRIATLSGGERQRVALAGAIALRPAIVVLDEPTSQLDEAGARALAAACVRLRDAGTAVVVAEHRLDLFGPVAGRLLTVDRGRVREGVGVPGPPAQPRPARHPGAVGWRLDAVTAGAGLPVLEELTLEGRRGEVIAVTGRNGSGKTTLLRVLAGLLKPLAGTVERPAGRTAYLPQDPAALLHQPTVREEVQLTLRRTAGSEDVADLLLELGLADLGGRYPRDLSGGERQRAAIAAVIAGPPELALLDEPTRGMDGAARRSLVAAVDRLAAAGASVVLATHDEELARTVADRVVSLG